MCLFKDLNVYENDPLYIEIAALIIVNKMNTSVDCARNIIAILNAYKQTDRHNNIT